MILWNVIWRVLMIRLWHNVRLWNTIRWLIFNTNLKNTFFTVAQNKYNEPFFALILETCALGSPSLMFDRFWKTLNFSALVAGQSGCLPWKSHYGDIQSKFHADMVYCVLYRCLPIWGRTMLTLGTLGTYRDCPESRWSQILQPSCSASGYQHQIRYSRGSDRNHFYIFPGAATGTEVRSDTKKLEHVVSLIFWKYLKYAEVPPQNRGL